MGILNLYLLFSLQVYGNMSHFGVYNHPPQGSDYHLLYMVRGRWNHDTLGHLLQARSFRGIYTENAYMYTAMAGGRRRKNLLPGSNCTDLLHHSLGLNIPVLHPHWVAGMEPKRPRNTTNIGCYISLQDEGVKNAFSCSDFIWVFLVANLCSFYDNILQPRGHRPQCPGRTL